MKKNSLEQGYQTKTKYQYETNSGYRVSRQKPNINTKIIWVKDLHILRKYTRVDSSENDKFHLFLILKILSRVVRWFKKVINNAYIIIIIVSTW